MGQGATWGSYTGACRTTPKGHEKSITERERKFGEGGTRFRRDCRASGGVAGDRSGMVAGTEMDECMEFMYDREHDVCSRLYICI